MVRLRLIYFGSQNMNQQKSWQGFEGMTHEL
jgi:hypothetical protein